MKENRYSYDFSYIYKICINSYKLNIKFISVFLDQFSSTYIILCIYPKAISINLTYYNPNMCLKLCG